MYRLDTPARRLYAFGVALAVLGVASDGYVQPDEWFQSVEIGARDVLGQRVWVPWEWGGADSGIDGDPRAAPCRSAAFAYAAAHAPFYVLRWLCGGARNALAHPRLVQAAPRLWCLLWSLLHDAVLWRVLRSAGLERRAAEAALALRRASWGCWVLETRPFSNAYETWGLTAAASLSFAGRPAALGAATALVVWWRFDFAAFAAPLGWLCVRRSPKPWRAALAGGLGFCVVGVGLVALDSRYFAAVDGGWVVAPWRNGRFNADARNLERFTLHPRYTHLLLNLPMLFGPLLLLGRPRAPKLLTARALAASALLGVLALSAAPHQEARFLLPAGAALFAAYGPRVAPGGLSGPGARRFYAVWAAYHALVGGFWCGVHQAGVLPAVRALGREPDGYACDHALFVGAYLPPRAVAGARRRLYLHDFENDDVHFGERFDALRRVLSDAASHDFDPMCGGHKVWVLLAASADVAGVRAQLEARRATLRPETSFWPHFSGELPPRRPSDLSLDLYDVIDPKTGKTLVFLEFASESEAE